MAILNPARKVLQEEPSLSWILAAGKDTQKELDRSFFRRWAMSLEEASGRTHKVWYPHSTVSHEGGQAEAGRAAGAWFASSLPFRFSGST